MNNFYCHRLVSLSISMITHSLYLNQLMEKLKMTQQIMCCILLVLQSPSVPPRHLFGSDSTPANICHTVYMLRTQLFLYLVFSVLFLWASHLKSWTFVHRCLQINCRVLTYKWIASSFLGSAPFATSCSKGSNIFEELLSHHCRQVCQDL